MAMGFRVLRTCGGRIPSPTIEPSIRYSWCMTDKPNAMDVLKATRPWWIVPIIVLFGLALLLVLTDVAPLRQFAYTVF
jgi:hypothetical protein